MIDGKPTSHQASVSAGHPSSPALPRKSTIGHSPSPTQSRRSQSPVSKDDTRELEELYKALFSLPSPPEVASPPAPPSKLAQAMAALETPGNPASSDAPVPLAAENAPAPDEEKNRGVTKSGDKVSSAGKSGFSALSSLVSNGECQ